MILFLLWLCFSGADDLVNRKARNLVAGIGLFISLLFSAMGPKIQPLGVNFVDSLSAMILCFLVFIAFYVNKQMAGGDVKFAVVLASFIGIDLILPVWALSCFFALLHAIFINRKLLFVVVFLRDFNVMGLRGKVIPYVTYLSLATITVLFLKNN